MPAMSLSDRLAAAARAREASRPGSAVPLPADIEAARAVPLTDRPGTAIVLPPQPGLRVVAAEPDPDADPVSICPSCARTGDLGLLDLPGRTAHWSCRTCGTMWRVELPTHTEAGTALDGLPAR